MMKKWLLLLLAMLAVAPIRANAQETGLDSIARVALADGVALHGFFPRYGLDEHTILCSNTEGDTLTYYSNTMARLLPEDVVKICGGMGCGFNAEQDPSTRNIYCVQATRGKDNLIYRRGMCFYLENGQKNNGRKPKQVLKPQHGAMQVVKCTRGIAIIGEKSQFFSNDSVGLGAYTLGDRLYVINNNKIASFQPVQGSAGYLWASVSPSGRYVMFDAVGKGVFIVDMQGNIVRQLDRYMMPRWLTDDVIVAQSSAHGNYQHHGSQLLIVHINTGKQTVLTDDGIHPSVWRLSGDNRFKMLCTDFSGRIAEYLVHLAK